MALSADGVTHLCCPGQGGEKDQGGMGSQGWDRIERDGMGRPRGSTMVLQVGVLGSPCLPMPAGSTDSQTALTLQHPARIPGGENGQRVCLRPPRHLPELHHHKGCTARKLKCLTYPSGQWTLLQGCHHHAVSPPRPGPLRAVLPAGTSCQLRSLGTRALQQGQGVRPWRGVNARLISRWSFPLQTIRQCPAGAACVTSGAEGKL